MSDHIDPMSFADEEALDGRPRQEQQRRANGMMTSLAHHCRVSISPTWRGGKTSIRPKSFSRFRILSRRAW